MKKSNNFPDRLRTLRKRAKITQPELAELVGVHETTIRCWEAGTDKGPSVSDIKKICQVLNVSEKELFPERKQEHWAVEVVIGDYEEEEMIDFSKDMLSITRLNATSNGINVNLIGGWDMVMNDAKFADMLEQVKAQRDKLIKAGTEVFNISNDFGVVFHQIISLLINFLRDIFDFYYGNAFRNEF